MSVPLRQRLITLLRILALLIIIRVQIAVLWNYPAYLVPDFDTDFLRGRQSHFFGLYQVAFYTHLVSGPLSILLGLILFSRTVRSRLPRLHRVLGRAQMLNLLLLLTPSGLWMAFYAEAGPIAVVGFLMLTLLTASCALLGWRAAVSRRFDRHQRWMTRTLLLLGSAILIRILGGTATYFELDFDGLNPALPWLSWILPIGTYELCLYVQHRAQAHGDPMPAVAVRSVSTCPAPSAAGPDSAASVQSTAGH